MKLIHCADIHLDSKLTANLSDEKARERRIELLEAYKRMVDYAVKNRVDAIIIAGDLFDTRSISATACNVVRDSIVNNPQIDFYYLQGNHDANSFLSRLEEIPENLKLFDDKWISYEAGEENKVVISGIELGDSNSPDWFNTLVFDNDKFNIVVLHGQESASKQKNKAEVIPLAELANKGIDYLALGHIHGYKYEKLDGRGFYCYPGCLECRGFDEPGEHGFVLLEINEAEKKMVHSFVENSYRNLYEIEVDVTGLTSSIEISTKVEKELSLKKVDSRHLVAVILKGFLDVSAEKDTEYISTRLANMFYGVRVYDETKIKVNADDYKFDESLKGEFVRNVLAAEDIDTEDKMAVISYGIRALAGEEIHL